MRLVIFDDKGKRILTVSSDGEARYRVTGTQLRDNVKSYKTDDDLHIVGLVALIWGAHNSREYLRRRINENSRESHR